MPADEYTSAIGGGLKLKGAKPSGIKKKKSKKPKETTPTSDSKATALQDALAEEDAALAKQKDDEETPIGIEEDGDEDPFAGKTEAERRHEEMRRKRLNDRLKKEGAKTHKQRVEELNKYLSNLSEHHDMPRIGPG